MAQIVHDLAPGSPIDFATAFISEPSFAANITALADQGAKVIVDDVSYIDEPMYQDGMTGPDDGFSLMAGIVSPKARGSVRLSGPGPHDPLLIDLDALGHPDDVASLVASVRQCRSIGGRPALAAWGATEVHPGPEVADDDLEDYVRRTAITYHHQVGTCAMGVDGDAVVTPRLRVHGVAGVRVADASVMPTVTTGNTNAPSVVIGEQAARFLLADA